MHYSPVCHFTRPPKGTFSFDLHVLSTPPAFALSQDQTLQFDCETGLKKPEGLSKHASFSLGWDAHLDAHLKTQTVDSFPALSEENTETSEHALSSFQRASREISALTKLRNPQQRVYHNPFLFVKQKNTTLPCALFAPPPS